MPETALLTGRLQPAVPHWLWGPFGQHAKNGPTSRPFFTLFLHQGCSKRLTATTQDGSRFLNMTRVKFKQAAGFLSTVAYVEWLTHYFWLHQSVCGSSLNGIIVDSPTCGTAGRVVWKGPSFSWLMSEWKIHRFLTIGQPFDAIQQIASFLVFTYEITLSLCIFQGHSRTCKQVWAPLWTCTLNPQQ